MKRILNKNNPDDISFHRRVVVKFHDNFQAPYGVDEEINDFMLKNHIISWELLLHKYPGIQISKLFTTLEPGTILGMVKKAGSMKDDYRPPNFLTYFAIDFPEGTQTNELLDIIWQDKNIEYAYHASGPTDPPNVKLKHNPLTVKQGYLDPAPKGIDARFAQTVAGGKGAGIGFIDIEQGWDLEHEDLPNNPHIPLLSGKSHLQTGHGTAVLGIILAQDNAFGILGISPEVNAGVVSQFRTTANPRKLDYNTADAIMNAIHSLQYGDVLLLEAQILSDDSANPSFYPYETEYATFQAIELGTSLGIVIIEPAGNGGNDLDQFQDDHSKFTLKRAKNSDGSTNPDFKDSGAIMVASASSKNPHVKDTSSNHGSRIDCYAWGEKIETTGDGSTGTSPSKYTPDFGSTSGASAIIAGAAILVQSMRVAKDNTRFSPAQIRDILSNASNGTAASDTGDLIGVMPNLKFIAENAL